MSKKISIAVVGLGKMGLSHFAIVNAHPDTDTVACDATGFMVDMLDRNIPAKVYRDYDRMLDTEPLDAVVIATPTRLHAPMVRAALDRGLHVFCEKPFCLDPEEAANLADLAERRGLINQVGYHNRYVGAFRKMKEIVETGALGRITHVLAEAYGPVVLRSKRQTWRSQKTEGGGCLYDYAAHPLNLLNWMFGDPQAVSGSVMESIFSQGIDDQVMSTLRFDGGVTAQLSVNWSDEAHRKMTTRISMIGTNGRINADRQECQVYLRQPVPDLPEFGKGWTVKYTTELTRQPWFYLRGEEYSNQIDDFISAVRDGRDIAGENDFRSAARTDHAIRRIIEDAEVGPPVAAGISNQPTARNRKRRWFDRA